MTDPTKRRMVTCIECEGRKKYYDSDTYSWKECLLCDGAGIIPEPAEVWALRLQRMYQWLSIGRPGCPNVECGDYKCGSMDCSTARPEAAEKAMEEKP